MTVVPSEIVTRRSRVPAVARCTASTPWERARIRAALQEPAQSLPSPEAVRRYAGSVVALFGGLLGITGLAVVADLVAQGTAPWIVVVVATCLWWLVVVLRDPYAAMREGASCSRPHGVSRISLGALTASAAREVWWLPAPWAAYGVLEAGGPRHEWHLRRLDGQDGIPIELVLTSMCELADAEGRTLLATLSADPAVNGRIPARHEAALRRLGFAAITPLLLLRVPRGEQRPPT